MAREAADFSVTLVEQSQWLPVQWSLEPFAIFWIIQSFQKRFFQGLLFLASTPPFFWHQGPFFFSRQDFPIRASRSSLLSGLKVQHPIHYINIVSGITMPYRLLLFNASILFWASTTSSSLHQYRFWLQDAISSPALLCINIISGIKILFLWREEFNLWHKDSHSLAWVLRLVGYFLSWRSLLPCTEIFYWLPDHIFLASRMHLPCSMNSRFQVRISSPCIKIVIFLRSIYYNLNPWDAAFQRSRSSRR